LEIKYLKITDVVAPQLKLKLTMWPSPWNNPFQWPPLWKGWTPLV